MTQPVAQNLTIRNVLLAGILLMLAGDFLFALNDAMGKWLVASFSVSLSQTDNGTQTTIVVPKADDGGEIYDGKQHYSHPALMQPLRPAVQELIDAAMEHRPFDWHRLPDPLNVAPNDSLNNCSMGQQSLARGIPVELGDPEGVPHDVAVNLGLIR
jgi:hypothetical protein